MSNSKHFFLYKLNLTTEHSALKITEQNCIREATEAITINHVLQTDNGYFYRDLCLSANQHKLLIDIT